MKRILAGSGFFMTCLLLVGCGGSSSAPTLSGPGFVVYTVYGTPGVTHPDPGVQIAGSVTYPQSCTLGSSGCNISFNATTDTNNGYYAFTTNDIPDTWNFSRVNDANCGGGSNAISYPPYLVGYASESVYLNCSYSQVYSAHLSTPTVYTGYQQTPPTTLTVYSDVAGTFGSNGVTVRSYNTGGSVEDQVAGVPGAGGSSITVPFDSTLATSGYHILAIPSSTVSGTYAAAVTLHTVYVSKPPSNPCGNAVSAGVQPNKC